MEKVSRFRMVYVAGGSQSRSLYGQGDASTSLQFAAIFVLIHNAFICMKGAGARMSAFVGAFAIADLVKSTLGPKGMDKILCPMVSFVSYRLVLKSAVICV